MGVEGSEIMEPNKSQYKCRLEEGKIWRNWQLRDGNLPVFS